MCVVSMVGDYFGDKFTKPYTYPQRPEPVINWEFDKISREEFEELKAEVLEIKKLLLSAKRFDEQFGEPDCSMEEKVATLKKVADALGVDLSEIFGK